MKQLFKLEFTLRELLALVAYLGTSAYFCWYMHRTDDRLFSFAHQMQQMLTVGR